MEEAVQSCYNWGGIPRCLFRALISAERYYKEWRKLFGALIIGGGGVSRCLFEAFILAERYNKGVERSGEAYLELLYRWRKLFGALISAERSGEACLKQLY